MESSVQQFVELVARCERFVVTAHHNPDGDAVGATLAMGLLLQQLGKDVVIYNRDPVPYNFQFLPGTEQWVTEIPPGRYDATVLLDCAEPARVGDEFPSWGWGDEVVVVDHHKTWDPDFASCYVRDVAAAATGEVVYTLLKALGADLTPELAKTLYCCVMSDTGSFRYSNTSKRTFTIAGELVEAGVNPWEMTSEIYESQPLERLELLGLVLDTLRLGAGGRLAFLRIERSMVERTGATFEMIDGFINYGRSIAGVEVATQLREVEGGWAVSFRSRGKVDVSELANRFGGGGHHNAAGCRMTGEPDDLERQLSDALVEMLDG